MPVTEDMILTALKSVNDPELRHNVVELGLSRKSISSTVTCISKISFSQGPLECLYTNTIHIHRAMVKLRTAGRRQIQGRAPP